MGVMNASQGAMLRFKSSILTMFYTATLPTA